MARIRSIKPEFWDSPSTAKASPWARLLFIAMWNWADDFGRGTANLKELEGFAFPNDDGFTDMRGNTVHFRDLVAEVSDCFGVMFYEVSGRPYYAIPSWETHQRNERRAKASKYPSPEVRDSVAEIPCKSTEDPNISGAGTGEQGNRGTGEQGTSSSEIASDPEPEETRPDVDELLNLLDHEIERNGNRTPKRTKGNHDAIRLLIDRDGADPAQIANVIRWCQQDNFWKANILSGTKLREKFGQLEAKMRSGNERPAALSFSEERNQRANQQYLEYQQKFVEGGDDPWTQGSTQWQISS